MTTKLKDETSVVPPADMDASIGYAPSSPPTPPPAKQHEQFIAANVPLSGSDSNLPSAPSAVANWQHSIPLQPSVAPTPKSTGSSLEGTYAIRAAHAVHTVPYITTSDGPVTSQRSAAAITSVRDSAANQASDGLVHTPLASQATSQAHARPYGPNMTIGECLMASPPDSEVEETQIEYDYSKVYYLRNAAELDSTRLFLESRRALAESRASAYLQLCAQEDSFDELTLQNAMKLLDIPEAKQHTEVLQAVCRFIAGHFKQEERMAKRDKYAREVVDTLFPEPPGDQLSWAMMDGGRDPGPSASHLGDS